MRSGLCTLFFLAGLVVGSALGAYAYRYTHLPEPQDTMLSKGGGNAAPSEALVSQSRPLTPRQSDSGESCRGVVGATSTLDQQSIEQRLAHLPVQMRPVLREICGIAPRPSDSGEGVNASAATESNDIPPEVLALLKQAAYDSSDRPNDPLVNESADQSADATEGPSEALGDQLSSRSGAVNDDPVTRYQRPLTQAQIEQANLKPTLKKALQEILREQQSSGADLPVPGSTPPGQ